MNNITLQCDMSASCAEPVSHIDDRGFIYCGDHGISRQSYCRCRKLRPFEIKLLQAGRPIPSYDPGPAK